MVSANEKGNHPVIFARINRTDLQTELFIMSENSVLYMHIIWTIIAATAIPKKIIEGTGPVSYTHLYRKYLIRQRDRER